MNYKRLRELPSLNFEGAYQPFTKRSRIDNEEYLNFCNPPDHILEQMTIPRRIIDHQTTDINAPFMNYTVSPIIPPIPHFSQIKNNFRPIDDPVTKAVVDNITEKLKTIPKQMKYYRCKQCNLSLSGQATLDAHLAGARHAKKIKELELNDGSIGSFKKEKVKMLAENEFMCKLCDVSVSSLVMIKSHIDGSKHKKKIKEYREKKYNKSKSNEKLPKSNDEATTFHLDEKNNSSIVDSFPLLGKNDSKIATTKSEVKKVFYCDACGLSMNSQLQYDQHINSKKHTAKVSKMHISTNECWHLAKNNSTCAR